MVRISSESLEDIKLITILIEFSILLEFYNQLLYYLIELSILLEFNDRLLSLKYGLIMLKYCLIDKVLSISPLFSYPI